MSLWHRHRPGPQWTHTVCKTFVLALNPGVQQLITRDNQWFCWGRRCSYSLTSSLVTNPHPLGRYQKKKRGLGRRLEKKESKGTGKELGFDILWCFCSKVSPGGSHRSVRFMLHCPVLLQFLLQCTKAWGRSWSWCWSSLVLLN